MIDVKAAEQALRETQASVTKAAEKLGVRPTDLRRFMATRPELIDVALEAAEREVDKAERILLDGLDQADTMKRLEAAARILKGRFRGSE